MKGGAKVLPPSAQRHSLHASLRDFELPLLVELASNALGDNVLVGPLAAAEGGGLGKLVAGVEHTSRPASPAEVDVGVLVHGVELLAESLQAAGLAGATSLGEDGLALVLLEPRAESLEDVNVVSGAGGVGAGSVGVKVLVHVEDEVGSAAVKVGDLGELIAGAVGDESTGVGPLVAGKENLVLSGTGLADGGHGGLNGGSPALDVHVVLGEMSVRTRGFGGKLLYGKTYGLVHHTESNLGVALVLGSNLRPKAGKLDVGRTALANNGTVPAAVVVHVDNAHGGAGIQAALDLLVVGGPVVGVEGTADGVDQVLPADGETESVEAVVSDEVLHLVETSLARVDNVAAARAVGSTAEVKTSDLS
jgi:hypothetical protein